MAVDLDAWREILPSSDDDQMYWDEDGVHSLDRDARGNQIRRRLTFRPIAPLARGVDQDDGLWLKVSWVDWRGRELSRWMLDVDARNPRNLEALPGASVESTSSRYVARWMSYAPPRIMREDVALATRLGWIEDKFVWPGHLCGREWVGKEINPEGKLEIVADGVRKLAKLPDGAGYLALVVLGMSAASPLIRWGCTRNPIIGLAQGSSRGKSTALEFGLSLWGHPRTWTLQGGSTVKGAQDLGTMFPDTPILLEDLHKIFQERPELGQELLYYCGNGQRRITSSRAQVAKGGEERKGVSFYGAEHQILDGAMGGVLFRTWELAGDPMPSEAFARSIAAATEAGAGAAGPRLAEYYSIYSPEHWRRKLSEDYRDSNGRVETESLSTGDINAVRCLAHGLYALRCVLSVMDLDVHAVCQWLIASIGQRRATQTDTVQVAWETLIQTVLGGHWGKHIADNGRLVTEDENRLTINNEVIAWRIPGMHHEESWVQLDINTGSSFARRVLAPYGRERTLLKDWRDRGWITPYGTHTKWTIRDHGRVAVRVSKAQLDHWTGSRVGDPDQATTTSEGVGNAT